MSIHNIPFHDKIRKLLNVCFLELSEEFYRDSKNEFESSKVNGVQSSRSYYIGIPLP